MAFALAWLTLETLGALAQRRMYGYYFLVLAPPAALVYGLMPRRPGITPLAVALLPAAVLSLVLTGADGLRPFSSVPRSPVSDYLTPRTSPRDAIWADHMPRLLIETNLRPGSRLAQLFVFVNYDDAPLDYCRILLHDFDQRRPKYVILPARLDEKLKRDADLPILQLRPQRRANYLTAWNHVRAYVDQHYAPEAQIEGKVVYKRLIH